MRRLIFALALFIALLGSFIGWTVHAAEAQQFYYIGPWEWHQELDAKTLKPIDFAYWRCPGGGCVGLIDLRSIPQMRRSGSLPEGYGLFVYEEPQLGLSLYYLGNSLNHPLKVSQKQWLEENLGLVQGITQSTILDVLYTDLLILNGDPTGQDRWKPLRGSLKTGVNLYLANELVKREEFTQNHIAFQGTIEVFQADYARLKEEGTSTRLLNKITGAKMQSLYGRMSDDLLEPLLGVGAADGWDKPSTTAGDTFVEASNTALASHTATGPNGGHSYTEVQGGMTVLAATDVVSISAGVLARSRAEIALSSDGHYAQLEVTALHATTISDIGPSVRWAAAANTCYEAKIRDSSNELIFGKVVAGVFTGLGNSPVSYTPALPDIVKYSVDEADNHEIFVDTVSKDTYSDTSITGNVRPGISGVLVGGGQAEGDNFEAADLEGETVITNAYWYSMALWQYMSPYIQQFFKQESFDYPRVA